MGLLALGALLGLIIAGYGLFTAKGTRSHDVPPEAIALVNNLPILRSDFITQVQTQFPFERSTTQQRKKVLEDMIAEELMVQRGLEIDLSSYDPDVRAALVAGVELEVTADVLAEQPGETQLRDYYARHRAKYVTEGVMRLRELVARATGSVRVDEAISSAQQAVAALRAGKPIDAVMQQYHLVDSGRLLDAGRVDTGDILEFAAKAKLDVDVYGAASRLQSGEISDALRQSDGVHIIVMLQHRVPVQQEYAAAADQVWTDYKNDGLAGVRAANIKYLRGRADVLLSDDARSLEAWSK
jgi:parvulin-like peptidyl-prolyl isomerase